MSVTTDGVKGYEYQYKVTLLIALVTDADRIDLFAEKKGSEDALLILEKNGISSNVEIQIKREKHIIDTPKIVNWLCHFQGRKSDNNLLQKLINSKQNIALFITQSRCSDSILELKAEFSSFKSHESMSFPKELYTEFNAALRSQKFGSTKLMKDREIFCKQQSENFKTNSDLNKVLEQCLIYEEFTDEKVDNYIISALNAKYSIAQSRAGIVYLQLLEIVKNGRDTGAEISKKINSHLQSAKIGIPIIDSQYKTRDEERSLIEELSKNGIILLTGISQCGKTELAKSIATHFVKKGYDYQIHDDIPELKRFLNSNVSDNKIAILEDPFGHVSLKDNWFEVLSKVRDLIGNKEKHHFIIVSSRIELLSDIFNSTRMSDYKIKEYFWHELTIKDNVLINSFWEYLATIKLLPHDIVKIVSKGILETRNEDILQIGQLIYLANEEIDQLSNKDFNTLEHIARRNSIEIASEIKMKNEKAASILSVVSICSDPIHKLEISDLAYILSSSTIFPSIIDKDVFTSSLGDNKTPIFPKYPHDLVPQEDVLDAINYLEERGFITLLPNSLIITHPNYYEAGRHLFFEKGSLKQIYKLEKYKKSIGCLNPISSFLATRNYSFIYNKIKTEHKKEIINIAFTGIGSIFPSVEDTSLIFLTTIIEELDPEQHDELVSKIQNGGTSSFNIFWHNDIPFISDKSGFLNFFIKYDEASIKRAEALISKGIKPNIHDAWSYIESLEGKKLSESEIRLLLQFNEGFIRQKVVYLIFSHPKIINEDLINELFNDEHPSVVFSVIRASLLSWFSLTAGHRELIVKSSLASLKKKHVAIRAFSLISSFSIDYSRESVFRSDFDESHKNEMWKVWGLLFPVCMENVPLSIDIHSGRFDRTMQDSMDYLDEQIGLEVLKAWYKRIDYQIKNEKILDESEMSIADILMKLTKTNSNIRKDIFSELINYNNTSFLLSNLKWVIEYWTSLDITEKEQIINLTKSNREDLRWIKAVILNSYSPTPNELTKSILGIDLDSLEVNDIVKAFPDQLLKDCLNVYCGFPQPLWWLAVHHHNRVFWGNIIRFVLKDEENISFEICLQEFLKHAVKGSGDDWIDWEQLWKNLCVDTKNKRILALTLVYNTAKCAFNIDYTSKLWATLIECYVAVNKEDEIIEFVVENIEILQQTGYKEDLLKIFNSKFLQKVIEKIQPDYFIFSTLEQLTEELPLVDEEIVIKLNELVQQMHIRFFGTFIYIDKLIEIKKISSEFKSLPNLIDKIGKNKLAELKHIEEYKLDNWIGIN